MAKRVLKKILNAGGLELSRHDKNVKWFKDLYRKYKQYTMIPEHEFILNLELCSKFASVQGNFVECGVWRGGMSAAIMETSRSGGMAHLFDSFEGLPPAKDIDGKEAIDWQRNTDAPGYYDNCKAEESFAMEAMKLAGHSNYQLHRGWFDQTTPAFKNKPIAILRLDGDWYDSIMTCLVNLFPEVVHGGIVVLDDYYVWDGCAKAVHDYLSKVQSPSRIYQWKNQVAYIIKK